MIGWGRQTGLSGKLTIMLVAASAVAGIATYAAWTGTAPMGARPELVLVLLVVDLVLLLLLGALIARQLVRLWVERRSGSAGSRLHLRLVALFSLVAVAPAIITAVFSALIFQIGLQGWFSERVGTAVQESLAVADAYIAEHRNVIRGDVLAMANDLNRMAPDLARDRRFFDNVLQTQTAVRSLSEATVFDASGRIVARTTLSLAAAFDNVPLLAVERANEGEVVILGKGGEDRVYALIRLDRFIDAYLYVGRFVDPVVVNHVERTREVVSDYVALEGVRSRIQVTSFLIFIVVALLLLVVAVWLGLVFANRLVRPIGALVAAAERVREGDLEVVVQDEGDDDEIATLSRAFNRMTSQLAGQRRELVEANRQLDRRRRFTEAVLTGVSAGVIGVDRDGRVNLPNRSAAKLLGTEVAELTGRRFAEVAPEMASLLEMARSRPDRVVEDQVRISRRGRWRTLIVRVDSDRTQGGAPGGYVVTFDDVTELVAAQRTAAWADVARRIAHEIKNPLTPIQLSAERLKRKYLGEIESDPEVFTQCTDTIVRQVGDIGRMVDEFTAFARMPAPSMKPEDLGEIVRQELFSQKVAHPDIDFRQELPETPVVRRCDGRQISQVLANVLHNAADAIEGRETPSEGDLAPGWIAIEMEQGGDDLAIVVTDNGRGLPQEHRERLTEPYVTTRSNGTGLGLAIVQKIMEDHGGRIVLEDAETGGARVRLEFAGLDNEELGEESGKRSDEESGEDPNDDATADGAANDRDGVAHGA
jgi:two-component system nitrogen regulation sensor histidine kinase NtrY